MKIYGFQKLTLLDYPGRVAATLFTGGCNLRCPFCHNATLVTRLDEAGTISEAEVLPLLKKRAAILDGVCISGGEPLIHPDIEQFIEKIKTMGYAVKLDTNGCYPAKLQRLCEHGLIDYVAMDIKNSLESYPKTVGIPDFDTAPIEQSADFLMNGSVDYEFRTTVVAELHNESDFYSIARRFSAAKRYFLQGFVDSGKLITTGLHGCDAEQMENFREILAKQINDVQLRGIDA